MSESERETVSKETVIKWHEERERVAKMMAKDDSRTKRQREVEACFTGTLPVILEDLMEEEASKTAVVDRINTALSSNGFDGSLSRPTLYNWLDEHGLK